MASINRVEVGQVLYKPYKRKMGNTTISTTEISQITVKEVNVEGSYIVYRSRAGYDRKMRVTELKSWRVNRPVLIESFTGSKRLATRAEIKAMKEKSKEESVK